MVVEAGEGGLKRNEYLRSMEDARWKLVHVPSKRSQQQMQQMEYELYETRVDVMETENVVNAHPGLVKLMQALLAERTSDPQEIKEDHQLPEYTQEELDNLRALGYLR